jgi:hypothetical protein
MKSSILACLLGLSPPWPSQPGRGQAPGPPGTVSGVEVNGRDAGYELSGGELVITPRRYLRDRDKFVVEVDFTAGPTRRPTPSASTCPRA